MSEVTELQLSCNIPLVYSLVTPYEFLKHEPGESFVILEVNDALQEESVLKDAFILFSRERLSLHLPITVIFEGCFIESVRF